MCNYTENPTDYVTLNIDGSEVGFRVPIDISVFSSYRFGNIKMRCVNYSVAHSTDSVNNTAVFLKNLPVRNASHQNLGNNSVFLTSEDVVYPPELILSELPKILDFEFLDLRSNATTRTHAVLCLQFIYEKSPVQFDSSFKKSL